MRSFNLPRGGRSDEWGEEEDEENKSQQRSTAQKEEQHIQQQQVQQHCILFWLGLFRPAAHFSFFSRRIESLQLILGLNFSFLIWRGDSCAWMSFRNFHLMPFIKIWLLDVNTASYVINVLHHKTTESYEIYFFKYQREMVAQHFPVRCKYGRILFDLNT